MWKTLRQNFQIFVTRCLVVCRGNLVQSRKTRVLCILDSFFFFFLNFSFPSNIFYCSLSCPFIPLSNPSCFSHKLPLLFIVSTSIFKKKVWVFFFSLNISCLQPWISWFLSYYGDLRYMLFEHGFGYFCWVWLIWFCWFWLNDAWYTCFLDCFSVLSMLFVLTCAVHIIHIVKCLLDICVCFTDFEIYTVCELSLVHIIGLWHIWLYV